jgi:hypothetical protein
MEDDDGPPILLEGKFQEVNKADDHAQPNQIGEMIGNFFRMKNTNSESTEFLQQALNKIFKEKEPAPEEVQIYFLDTLKTNNLEEAKQLTKEKFKLQGEYKFKIELEITIPE